MKNAYQKLQTVQSKLKAPKGQYNSFGKYSYRSCEDILEALKPILNEVKAVVTISDEVLLIGERYYIKATAKFIDYESDSEPIEVTALAREEDVKKGMDSSQVSGSTSSYARKYCLSGLLCIDDNKDSDFTNKHGKEETTTVKAPQTTQIPAAQSTTQPTKATVKGISDAQIKRMYAIANAVGVKADELKELVKSSFSVEDMHLLSKEQYDRICKKFEGMKK